MAGSASIALNGTLYRPLENPLHDIDFNASRYSKEELDNILEKEFHNVELINTIKNNPDAITYTYVTIDKPFKLQSIGFRLYNITDAETGESLGRILGSELILKEGVKGKLLDFFTGKEGNLYGESAKKINGKDYVISDYRNAFNAKIRWAREKDIWDYNRFVPNSQGNDRFNKEVTNSSPFNARESRIFGFNRNGEIYLNTENIDPSTPVHEYTHDWVDALRHLNTELYNRGMEIAKESDMWEEITRSPPPNPQAHTLSPKNKPLPRPCISPYV